MKTVIFVVVSAFLIYVSRHSFRAPSSHGFYRFFAWEFMLGLFLLNANYWFYKPLAWNQIIAWALLFASLIPLGFGIHFLQTQGKPTAKREGDVSLLAFEKTTNLVTSGIYKYIRHPLYSSLLLLTWGTFFKHFSAAGFVLAIPTAILLVFTAKADEMECIQFFGSEYSEYMKRTKRFIPYLY